MSKKIVFCLLLFPFTLLGSTFCLKDKFAHAEPGGYIVLEQNKNATLLHLCAVEDRTLFLEEVSIPLTRYARYNLPWKEWFALGAPGHTSWTRFTIHLDTKEVKEYGSLTDPSEKPTASHTFLATLLHLKFRLLPEEKRRHIGRPSGQEEAETRPLWHPPLLVEGQRIAAFPFLAWRALWPADGSELASHWIEVYFPSETEKAKAPPFPTYFPYWIEIDTQRIHAKIRALDSGTHLASPHPWPA